MVIAHMTLQGNGGMDENYISSVLARYFLVTFFSE